MFILALLVLPGQTLKLQNEIAIGYYSLIHYLLKRFQNETALSPSSCLKMLPLSSLQPLSITSRLSGPPLPRYTDLLWWLNRHFSGSSPVSWHSWWWAECEEGNTGQKEVVFEMPTSPSLIPCVKVPLFSSLPTRLSFLHHRPLARGNWLSTNYLGLSGGSAGKESACIGRDLGLIPGLGRSPAEGNGNPLPVFLPGEFHGQRSLVGYSPWGHKELDIIEQLTLSWHTNCLLFTSFYTLKDNVRGTKTKHNGYPNDLISHFMKRGMDTLCGRSPPQQAET